jgi:GNAT superfamily N-acetyltransferase
MTGSIRAAAPTDLPLIAALIRELAEYEHLSHAVHFEEATLGSHLFGEHPAADVLIAEWDGAAVGFALFFQNFSTFAGRPGLYLEDLFIRPEARGHGLGRALLEELARIALARNCARLEWAVLDWNTPSIGFYETIGAQMRGDWRIMRMEGDALARLGAQK